MDKTGDGRCPPGPRAAPWCGTAGGYTNHRCRDVLCRRAWGEYIARYREAKRLEATGEGCRVCGGVPGVGGLCDLCAKHQLTDKSWGGI